VSDYLRTRFANADISHRASETGDILTIRDGSTQHTLVVDPDFLAGKSEDDIVHQLQIWEVDKELRHAEGLPLTITPAGVRLSTAS
jgi:hypothetical protein